MSEWPRMASVLSDRFNFTNTYYHREPFLDVTGEIPAAFTGCDFVLCAEVLEHVLGDIAIPLRNLRKMLRPGGMLILTTPFASQPDTAEHFPGIIGFELTEEEGRWTVLGELRDGTKRLFTEDVHFHGGPGTVLEMRRFGERSLLRALKKAGFDITVHRDVDLGVGYYWPIYQDRPGLGLHYVISARVSRYSWLQSMLLRFNNRTDSVHSD